MDQWDSVGAFFQMGGYGKFVWGAYSAVLFCLICEVIGLIRRRQKAARELMIEARAHLAEEDL